ncbi:tyrosine phosphatase-like protein [Dunaliella salina]|uniref:Very-long-chain (3R)-3-hydroxyacyl-CoA dehydratase n=1 Tax=Dunaliella salina TaxID=3046 RepID=A0ABQ7GL32_DUNSA|nr:tyrosine phosphatase-like protein [Dunaliella salina]|eukprot:KAF5835319.1 tyrosine phosphatase-like protein [Dunaliella salina]
MTLKTSYLLLYNTLQAVGWAVCLCTLLSGLGSNTVYNACSQYVRAFQGLAILESLHAALGIVPSNPGLALLQWAGRSNVLFLVLGRIPEASARRFRIVAVVRYPWYALSLVDKCPAFLTWLRYSLFIPIYPVGVLAEMLLLYQALPFIEARDMYSVSMPNPWNVGFSYLRFCQVGLFVYLPIWWQLYSTMLRQRKKKLGVEKSKSA